MDHQLKGATVAAKTIGTLPETRNGATCRRCQKSVVWITTVTGLRLLFNSDPLVVKTDGNPISGRVVEHVDEDEVHGCPR